MELFTRPDDVTESAGGFNNVLGDLNPSALHVSARIIEHEKYLCGVNSCRQEINGIIRSKLQVGEDKTHLQVAHLELNEGILVWSRTRLPSTNKQVLPQRELSLPEH
ncbi:hypothetical protein E2C01_044938 [Portunus trituberculatus]|uniref:Uncharacterized protein n=1 Tax=Portunus trituberculatus TaxID=210409 RepID=A0A5B7G0S5_PORTR|nr:hypothetical protein [Portunus trituberculatus]